MADILNRQIRAREVLVIDSDGEKLGVMPRNKAIFIAQDKDMDLLLVADKANPVVCKIVDYGKYKYDLKKKQKEAKANSTIVKVKTVKVRPNIEENDLRISVNRARKFIEGGDRVQFKVMVFGRYHQNKDWIVENVAMKFVSMLEDIAKMDGPIRRERDIEIHLVSKTKTKN